MKNRAGILILILLVAVVLGAGPALAKTIHEEVTVKPVKTISPAEKPITLTEKSLWQATRDYAAGKYAAAGEELEKAGAYLKKASKSADEKTREEAEKLGKDIDALKGKVKKGGKATGAAITNLWERSKALSEREAERISTGWQKLRAESKVKKDLIEAKLHIAYAETCQFITGNADKAGVEIDKAKGYLNSAAKNADSKVKAKINAMGKKMDEIKKDLHNKKDAAKMRYEIIKGDLRQLIKHL